MLRIFMLAVACVVSVASVARAGQVAPADEYFGPYKESILEVRNRLIRFEGDSASALSNDIHGMDVLEVTIEDWYNHYPGDPWIAGFSNRLIRLYERAHEDSSAMCVNARTRIARLEHR